MASYLNNTSSAGGGTAIGKDPDYPDGINPTYTIVGAVHRTLDGGSYQDYVTNKRRFDLKWTRMSATQWTTNTLAYLTTTAQLYWQGPEMAAKVAVIAETWKATPIKMAGDTTAAPHYDVTITLIEA